MHVYGMYVCMPVNISIPNTRACAHTHRHTRTQSYARTAHTGRKFQGDWCTVINETFQQEMRHFNTFWMREALASDTSFSLSFSRSDRTSPSKYLFAIPTRSSPNPTFGRWGSMDPGHNLLSVLSSQAYSNKVDLNADRLDPRTSIAARRLFYRHQFFLPCINVREEKKKRRKIWKTGNVKLITYWQCVDSSVLGFSLSSLVFRSRFIDS